MYAFHALRARGPQETFALEDFALFAMLLSALEWRRHNGRVKLITDSVGIEYLDTCGLLDAWDETEVLLDEMKSLGIDENVFWAGAKLYALSRQETPCVMMDLDFIAWQPMDFSAYGRDLVVIHREDICRSIYPPKEAFRFRDGWQLPVWLDWSARPCNAAFAYFGSQRFLREYTAFALRFMQMADAFDDRLRYMVFAEQRWMAMCAAHLAIPVHEISTLEGLFGGKQKYFTHIWGHKQRLRDHPREAEAFCRKCAGRLRHDFPAFAAELESRPWAAKYFKKQADRGE